MAPNFKDIAGERFGRLVAIECIGVDNEKRALWRCRCDCGRETIVQGKSLRSGNTKSCGCLNLDLATSRIVALNTTHGQSHSVLFGRWGNMLCRCYNSHSVNYKDYGARGIKVCDEWHDFATFYKWAMEHGYSESLTIDRIDPNGNYEPSNCRFATKRQQAENRRSSRIIEYAGEALCLSAWARKFGMHPSNLHGLSDEEALIKIERYSRRNNQ